MSRPVGTAPNAPGRSSKALRGVLLLALGGGGLLAIYATPLREVLGPEGVERARGWIADRGAWAGPVFVGLTAVGVAVGAPRLFFAALGGLAFGWLGGAALALLGAVGGSLITLAYARALGRNWLAGRIGPRLARLDDAFRQHGILTSLLLRAAPVGNCHLTNLVLAFSSIPVRDYLVGSLLGMAPETIIYALFGSAAGGGGVLRFTLAAMLLVALGASIAVVARRSRFAASLSSALRDTERQNEPVRPPPLESFP